MNKVDVQNFATFCIIRTYKFINTIFIWYVDPLVWSLFSIEHLYVNGISQGL